MTNIKPYNRTDRVSHQILEIIGETAVKSIDLSAIGFITFIRVEVSPDLRQAKVFYSVLNRKIPQEDLDSAINEKAKAFRKYLGQKIKIKYTPKLIFYNDDSLIQEEKMIKLLNKLKNTNK